MMEIYKDTSFMSNFVLPVPKFRVIIGMEELNIVCGLDIQVLKEIAERDQVFTFVFFTGVDVIADLPIFKDHPSDYIVVPQYYNVQFVSRFALEQFRTQIFDNLEQNHGKFEIVGSLPLDLLFDKLMRITISQGSAGFSKDNNIPYYHLGIEFNSVKSKSFQNNEVWSKLFILANRKIVHSEFSDSVYNPKVIPKSVKRSTMEKLSKTEEMRIIGDDAFAITNLHNPTPELIHEHYNHPSYKAHDEFFKSLQFYYEV